MFIRSSNWLAPVLSMLVLDCSSAGQQNLVAEAPRSEPVNTDCREELQQLSQAELAAKQASVHQERETMQTEAASAVDRRLHRIALIKYRDIESLLSVEILVLEEVRRRHSKLYERMKIGQKINHIIEARLKVRKMVGLLSLYSQR